jgi:hypothetical protein
VISSQPHSAYTVVKALTDIIVLPQEQPVIVGQSEIFSSPEFLREFQSLNNKKIEIYVLRQKVILTKSCPLIQLQNEVQRDNLTLLFSMNTPYSASEIPSLTDAQSYAAMQLLRFAVNKAAENLGKKFWDMPLQEKRLAVRDALATTTWDDIPCLGTVSFDNMGQNQNLQYEILKININDNPTFEFLGEDNFRDIFVGNQIKGTPTPDSFGPEN